MIALSALQTVQGAQQQRAAAKQADRQSDYLQQVAVQERAQAESNAELVRRQREMEKSQERRDYEQQQARARVGGVTAESLLAGADSFGLSTSQKDWLTGQQARNILDTGAQRATNTASQAASYGAQAKNTRKQASLSLLAGGVSTYGSLAGSL